ncbi:hypothetical protein EDM53_00455, partial [Rickettsiales endosymbiont of Peranema trichophorum]|uniref:hypothetical protein n=1 Tax=Rickettsiales endosymbiont of Peranema trichophorum TaxID=2486577 RepID=UPI001022C36D
KRASETKIRRHVKIRAEANPYDPKFREYFKQREGRRRPVKEVTLLGGQEPPYQCSSVMLGN